MFARQPFLRILWHQCPRAPLRPSYHANLSSSWRSFASRATRSIAAPKSAKRSPRPATPTTSSFKPGNIGKLAIKVAKEGKVVLFKAPSHKSYLFSAYGLGALCFAYAVWQSNNIFRDPVIPFPMWQKALFAGICVITSGLGTVVLSRTSNLVRTITAVKSKNHVSIRFTVRRLVPFQKPYTFEVLPSKVTVSRRLVVSPETMARYRNDNSKIGSAKAHKPNWFNPVELLSRGVWKLFTSMRQVFTGEDFILLEIDGHNGTLRMDSNGFVAEEFLALGDPVKFSKR